MENITSTRNMVKIVSSLHNVNRVVNVDKFNSVAKVIRHELPDIELDKYLVRYKGVVVNPEFKEVDSDGAIILIPLDNITNEDILTTINYIVSSWDHFNVTKKSEIENALQRDFGAKYFHWTTGAATKNQSLSFIVGYKLYFI